MFVNGAHVVYYMNLPKSKLPLYNIYKEVNFVEVVAADSEDEVREYIKNLGEGYTYVLSEKDDE